MNKILQEDFDLTPCMVAGYESFMGGLLNIVHSGPILRERGRTDQVVCAGFCSKSPVGFF